MDEKAVLKGSAGTVDVLKVVDRRALGLDPRSERELDRVTQCRELGCRQATSRPERVDPRAVKRLVGVDVPHPGNPPLIQHERLDRRTHATGERPQVLSGELRGQRLDAETLVEVGVPR